ncbi:MAG: hypothetical protein QRY16_21865 [Enterobacterales bacterium endosymbiont of Blomia tropicalis]|uniref:hypothetical protein n=1 Tax=Mixta mediterraneensis TaxID=2758443 RepID=UPI0025A91889|nr:hypothetical protein [Mixta mediterraneensis]MDL4916305.1 hypothetical protein [Mixta mediterraneensis]
MEKYYTLDSANSLYPFCRVSLGHYPPEQPELADFLNQMYPDGLSNHGRNYLYNPGPIMDGGGENGEGVNTDRILTHPAKVKLTHPL